VTTTRSEDSSKRNSDAPAPRMFWKFGAQFHGDEAVRADATDFIVFSAMGALCAWPIVSVAIAITHVFFG